MNTEDYLSRVKSLRSERAELKREQTILSCEPKQANDMGFVDARYARAVRMQAIDREIDVLKRANIVRVQ